MSRVITFGSFDVFHIGHLNILTRCAAYGDHIIVGISTDALNVKKKNEWPIYNQHIRKSIIENIKGVKEVFFEESLELKREYIKHYKADVLVMGDDWKGKFDFCEDLCKVVYLSRTPGVSTTDILQQIVKNGGREKINLEN